MLEEKNLDNYIKCLKNKIKEYKEIGKIEGKRLGLIRPSIPLEVINFHSIVYKLMAYEMVLKDLEEIITRNKEMEREEDESEESIWKSWEE